MRIYISIDPGKSVGIATWDENGNLLGNGKMQEKDFEAFLQGLTQKDYPNEIVAFIVEEYRIYGHKAQAHIGSKVGTAQCIGKIKMIARMINTPVVEQPATFLKITAKWAGVKLPKGHVPDALSAYLHGYHYLHQQGIIEARVLES